MVLRHFTYTRRLFTLALLAAVLSIVGGVWAQDAGNALTSGQAVTGTLDGDAVIEVYTIAATAGQALNVTAENDLGVPLALVVTNAAGERVATVVDDNVDGVTTLLTTLNTAGTYYVTIFKAGGVGAIATLDFTLTATLGGGSAPVTADTTAEATAPTAVPTTAAALVQSTTSPTVGTALPVATIDPEATVEPGTFPTSAPGVSINGFVFPQQIVANGLRISLTWNSTADLDIEVRDSVGGSLYFQTPTVNSGGTLSQNINQGCTNTTATNPTETATWPPGGLFDGSYEILVYYQQACDGETPTSFTINATANGVNLPAVTGTLLPSQVFVTRLTLENDGTPEIVGAGGVEADQLLPAPAAAILASAGAIDLDVATTGAITNEEPYQAYNYVSEGNEFLNATVGANTGSLDTFLYVLDSAGNIVASNDDLADGVTDSQISGAQLVGAGTYTIVVTRYAKAVGGTEGDFTVTATTGSGALPAAAAALPNGSLEVRVVWDTAADIQLLLRDSAGDSVFDDADTSRSGGILGADGNVNCRVPPADGSVSYIYYPAQIQPRLGSYEVEVWYQNACGETLPTTPTLSINLNGEEIFAATQQLLPNERYLTSFTIGADGRATPSDGGVISGLASLDFVSDIGSSVAVALGSPSSGSITPDNKFDLYVFSAQAGAAVSIAMTATSGTLDPLLYLVGPSGAQVAENDDVTPGTNRNALISNFTLSETGQYIIIATHFGARYGGTIGTYNLTLTQSG